eukprot:768027-Hanusia_phi.AAC.8
MKPVGREGGSTWSRTLLTRLLEEKPMRSEMTRDRRQYARWGLMKCLPRRRLYLYPTVAVMLTRGGWEDEEMNYCILVNFGANIK